jgi:hypothetical protein
LTIARGIAPDAIRIWKRLNTGRNVGARKGMMMNLNDLVKWAVNVLFAGIIALLWWDFNRECEINMRQDTRLMAVETDNAVNKQALNTIVADIREVKIDVKTLLRNNP